MSKTVKFVLFADDTNIQFSDNNLQQLCSTMTEELNKTMV